ncbi:MAG: glycosyltransferase [bacterium]|nr:glycosyltransferase [bacterium]
MKKISVIIPAYNEEQYIADTLDALSRQDFNREDFEIIVVDNASTDLTSSIARVHGADEVIFESRKGTNRARQTGVEQSNGEIVAFLDADCEPGDQWLSRIWEYFQQDRRRLVAVAGPYDYTDDPRLHFMIFQRMAWHVVFPFMSLLMGRVFRRGGVMLGGNFATQRKTLNALNGLDTSYEFFGDDASIARRFGTLGYVKLDSSLSVESSARRYQREGFIRTNWNYTRNYFKVMMR